MAEEVSASRGVLPDGLRDTQQFYADGDPMQWVEPTLVDEVARRCGPTLLDLGCGLGGYSKALTARGYSVRALDVNPRYVEVARSIGVDADTFDGDVIPLPDASVDTVFMIEVLEHVVDPPRLLSEVFRVARKNVIVTVPNNTQRFNGPVVWNHMLDVDHKHFFTVDSLSSLLASRFGNVDVQQIAPRDLAIVKGLLPYWLFRLYRWSLQLGLAHEQHYFRLVGCASK